MIESSYRRVPVYILVDTSGSMKGAPIEALNNQLKGIKDALMSDPYAIELAWISLITFGGDDAKIVCPLTDIVHFEPPILEASGLAPLGAAMKKLNECIDKEVRLRDKNYISDYKPFVYVLTYGRPDDDGWREAVEAVKNRTNRKVAVTITIGCGPEVDENVLSFISSGENDLAIKAEEMTPEIILSFFKVGPCPCVGNDHVCDNETYEEWLENITFIE